MSKRQGNSKLSAGLQCAHGTSLLCAFPWWASRLSQDCRLWLMGLRGRDHRTLRRMAWHCHIQAQLNSVLSQESVDWSLPAHEVCSLPWNYDLGSQAICTS